MSQTRLPDWGSESQPPHGYTCHYPIMITYVALMTASQPGMSSPPSPDDGRQIPAASMSSRSRSSHFYHPSNVPPQQFSFAHCGYSQVQSQSRNVGS